MPNRASPDTCLVLMLKAPERSKQRLRSEIGSLGVAAAARLAACALEDLAGWPGATCYAPASAADLAWLEDRVPAGALTIVQSEGNLGARIDHVNAELFRLGLTRQLFIGIDCPGIDPAYLALAADALATHDVVLGPADDGGVVLMGARRRWPPLAGLPWSTSGLCRALRGLCEAQGFGVATLPARADIDVWADLVALRASASVDSRPARRALRDWLREHLAVGTERS